MNISEDPTHHLFVWVIFKIFMFFTQHLRFMCVSSSIHTRIGMQILTYEWKMFNKVQTLWHLTFHTNYISVSITWVVWVSFSVKNIRVCLNLWTDITFSDEMKFFVLCQVFRHNSYQFIALRINLWRQSAWPFNEQVH